MLGHALMPYDKHEHVDSSEQLRFSVERAERATRRRRTGRCASPTRGTWDRLSPATTQRGSPASPAAAGCAHPALDPCT